MANLPDQTPPTVQAIYDTYIARNEEWRRAHLGASLIGRECNRELWYSFRWSQKPDFSGRLLRLFETGHLAEPRLTKNLRDAGIKVIDTDQETGEQFVFRDCGGHMGGSMDGCAHGFVESKKWHVLEYKTINDKGFAALKRHGVRKEKPEHFAQMQCYMHWSGMYCAYYFCVNKNTDEIYGERVKFDKKTAMTFIAKGDLIIYSPKPLDKITDDPAFYKCKFCDYSDICHRNKLPEINCRTCAHSTPMRENGEWGCEKHNKKISFSEQCAGCQSHVYNPAFIPLSVIDADAKKGTITYEENIINGAGGYSSQEMRDVDGDLKVLADPFVVELKETMGVRVE